MRDRDEDRVVPGQMMIGDAVDSLQGSRDGDTFEEQDRERLNAQHLRVYAVLIDAGWMTLRDIAQRSGDPESSVSARLRDFRKAKFGGHEVNKLRHAEGGGVFYYELRWNDDYPRPTWDQIREARK